MKRLERDEWIAALRSDDYLQGNGFLDTNGKQCCLGVKCLLDIKAGRHGIVKTNYNSFGITGITGSLNNRFPTLSIFDAWGFSSDIGNALASMNDKGSSFHEIAQWIEDNVPVED